MAALKVILNTETVRFPLTGIGRYTYELAQALRSDPHMTSLRYFEFGHFIDAIPEVQSTQKQPARLSVATLKQWVQKSALGMELSRHVLGYVRAQALQGHSDSIYHGTNFILPKFAGPCVATFHDLSPFSWAHCHPPGKIRYLQKELTHTLHCAQRLITDSEYTRQEVAAFSGIGLDRIDAVPLAAGPDFYPRPANEVQPVLNQYGLQYQGYCLYVGTIEPRKNLEALLSAYAQLPLAMRKCWPLVISGFQGWNSATLHVRIQQAVQQGWAKYLGYVAEQDLGHLFAGARVFAFPSHYEGFGLPVLEALSSGVPVVCSNSSSLPEVAGGAALLHEPDNIDLLTQHLQRALDDDLWRASAIKMGLAHASTFSWQRCALETVAVYSKLLQG